MRIARLPLLLAAIFLASPVLAKDAARVRPATETEIRQVLTRASDLKNGKNGYQYQDGSQIGYKISDGEICVLQQRRSTCVTVYTDGKRIETIDSRGNRDFLN